MKNIIETLYGFGATLINVGYDNALEWLKHLIELEVIEIQSGTELGTWTVPDEWVVRDAWVKFNGEKILDYKLNPLSLVVYSLPFQGKVTREELQKHLHYSDEKPAATPHVFKFYDKDWGFCVPKNMIKSKVPVSDEEANNPDYIPRFTDSLPEGEYEVFIDTEHKPGIMKIGVHTIPGKSDREILLFAHLDHPYQANDNLSGVACLVDLARKIKADHTVKIILCPETIGSIAYAHTQDISKVDFVLAVDICGNDNSILVQKSWNTEDKLNRVLHCALQVFAKPYRKGKFRTTIGSDETVFNDPLIGIPGVLLSTYPYKEYHTSDDTPEKINYEKIEEVQQLILKIIEIWEKDYIPERLFKGPLMRSRYGIQSFSPIVNLNFDYLFYSVDGKLSLVELCAEYELNFDTIYKLFEQIIHDGKLRRIDLGKKPVKKARKQK